MRLIAVFFLLIAIGAPRADEIDRLIQNKEYDQAFKRFRELYSGNTDEPEYLFINGKSSLSGEISASYLKDFINKSDDTYWTDWARLTLGKYYIAQRLHVTARKQLESIPDSSPWAVQAGYLAARCLFLAGEYDRAADKFENLMNRYEKGELNGQYLDYPEYGNLAQLGLADARLVMEDYDDAYRLYRGLLKTELEDDIFPLALLGLAETADARGNSDEADRFYDLYKEKYRSGLALSKFEEQPQKTRATESAAKPATQGRYRYYIQVGAFSLKDNALRTSSLYKNSGYKVYMETFIEGGKEFYRILIGGYNSKQQAEFIKKRLEKSAGEKYLLLER